jgi:hypothetical protein
MRLELVLPVLLLLLVLAGVLLRRERAKKASPVPVVAEPAPTASVISVSANVEARFTIQVWELGVVVFGLLLLAAHVVTGAPPLLAGLALLLTGALAVVLRTRRSPHG